MLWHPKEENSLVNISHRDTVASVKYFSGVLPHTTSKYISKVFRHAVSLDERSHEFNPIDQTWDEDSTDDMDFVDGSNGEASDRSAFAVVVDGETLKFCLDKNLKPLFLALTTQCETVVCCRVSPAQKALTVRFGTSNLALANCL